VNELRYSRRAWQLFDLGFRPWRRSRLDLFLAGLPRGLPEGRPLLLCPNHTSWWDGFLLREVHRKLRPRSTFHTVMLESELARFPFLRRLGGVGFTPGSPGSFRRLLRRFRERREREPECTVLFFPQGRIWPSHRRPLGFRPGVGLLQEMLSPAVVLPLALHFQAGRTHRMTAYISAAAPMEVEHPAIPVRLLEARVEEELDAVAAFLADHGEDAPSAWPQDPWTPLPQRTGEPIDRTHGADVPSQPRPTTGNGTWHR